MNMHPTPAERLLSMLEEDGAVEALPANEVRAELTAFGVDPARSIAFAKSLARDGGSPGGRLMGALLAAEEEDEEIARIESADIGEVRARVHHGAAAAIAAEAHRKAGIDDNVVALGDKRRKRRRSLVVWGGPLAGIAASVLIVFFMGNAYLSSQRMNMEYNIAGNRAEAPDPEMPDPALEGYTRPGPDGSLSDELLALNAPPKPAPAARAKEKSFADSDAAAPADGMLALNEPAPPLAKKKSVAPAATEQSPRKQENFALAPEPEPPLPLPSRKPKSESDEAADAPALFSSLDTDAADAKSDITGDVATNDGRAGIASRAANTKDMVETPDLPEIVTPRARALAEETAEAEIATAPSADLNSGVGLLRNAEISEIAAVLVVDPSRAPLQIQSQILPPGGLKQRLAEARGLAGDRPVIALYTIATGPTRQDFAQVPLQPGLTQTMSAPAPLVGLLGVEATEYDFIALPLE